MGDTDTNASIAGQIAGTLLGLHALPEEMIVRLPNRDMIRAVATGLVVATSSPPR